ncbi:alpha/beta fold hydrolase [Embleya scabrispora]|uniref:alpha/beta fold hydrolase n=1 Tax=Embleya scabrispora TaxID=159449 RepID=UPI00035F3984|nr:alpha/beta hydrolase [Embleya scabrispora]MYS79335.1 alpha/beta fold hydrolase [Streptomyces sp. SID5474]
MAARRPVPVPPGTFVRIDGAALHAVREGSGPVVIATSGLGGAWFDWDAVAPLLTADCTVVRFDRPGLGYSEPDPRPPTLAHEADRIAALADALALPGPYVLLAHSLGAFHVEGFARMYPERTAGLVLVDPSNEDKPRPRPARRARVRVARVVGGAMRVGGLARAVGPAARRSVLFTQSRRHRDVADARWVRGAYGSGRFFATALTENATYLDVAAELADLRRVAPLPDVPLRVLAAAGGYESLAARARWVRALRTLANLSPHGRCDVLDDSAHFVMSDRPDAVADAVHEVLSGESAYR